MFPARPQFDAELGRNRGRNCRRRLAQLDPEDAGNDAEFLQPLRREGTFELERFCPEGAGNADKIRVRSRL